VFEKCKKGYYPFKKKKGELGDRPLNWRGWEKYVINQRKQKFSFPRKGTIIGRVDTAPLIKYRKPG